MSKENIFSLVEKILIEEKSYCSDDGKLMRAAVLEAAEKMDVKLLSLLVNNPKIKEIFFTDINGLLVFDKARFNQLLQNKSFLPNSYTTYKNKIGLSDSHENFISSSNDVELVFPHKDCILEGGQTKEDKNRGEIFFNELLESEKITNLLSPKAFVNPIRYDGKKKSITKSIKNDDNLIIKGNNLIAVSSILNRYSGRVKCIYIDPPFNTGNDGFDYNDKFNHSSWLTFMYNRLIYAKKLLAEDGSIFVHLDWNEVHYCKVLMDEIFGRDCFRNEIIWCYTGPGSPKMSQLNRKHDNILWYSKNSNTWTFNGEDVRMKSEVHAGGFNGEMSTAVSNEYTSSGKIPEDWWELFHTEEDLIDEIKTLKEEASKDGMGDWWKCAVASRIRVDGKKRSGYLTEKPYKLMERIIKMSTNENDLVVDFFAGSGTTGYVCSYLNRQFVLIEQLDETQKILTNRFKDVNHVYCELAKQNQTYVEKIQECKTDKQIINLTEEILKSDFVSTRVNPTTIDVNASDYKDLSFEDKKKFAMEILDKNALYINASDVDDESLPLTDADRAFTKSFYGKAE